MNIDGLGPETVDMFYRLGLIKNTADLYQLTADDIKNLDRMGEKSAENIIKGIEASKEVPFERVLFALGIRFVGETVAKKIAKSFNDIDELENANLEKLINIDEIGEKIAQSILTYFANPLNRELIERLKSTGLQLYRREEDLSGYTDKLAGQSIVISGVFTHHSRDEYKELIEKNGGNEKVCGWLTDQFGMCWQVYPKILVDMMNDAEKAPKAVEAFQKMVKFDIQALLDAVK
jgi:DNA ligase (NAD+)